MNIGDEEVDGFPTPSIEYEYVWIRKEVFLAVLGLDGLVLLFSICCAIGINIYKKHLVFVNTGIALTHVFIVGCIMMLLSVPLFGIDSNLFDKINIPKACMARIWLFNVGYSFSVGIMIARVIYTAFMELIREFKSYQITSLTTLFFVMAMALIDTIVVLAWRWFSPPHKDYVTKEVELLGIRDERRTLVETCNSEKESLLIGFLCFYKGGLLLVALVISAFKREEEQTRCKDYNQSRIGLLSAVVAGAIGLPVVLSLPHNPNKSFAVGGSVLILEVLFLMIWVKGSKLIDAYKCKKGKALEFGKYSIEKNPRVVPCVRPVYGCANDFKNQGLPNQSYLSFESGSDVKDYDPESVKEADEDDILEDSGDGFDHKVSNDVLPDDLPSYEDYNLKPYDPDAEENKEEEEEETDDEAGDKPEGETSDDDSSDSSSDDEDSKEEASSSALAKSAVSVHLNKSNVGSPISIEDQNSKEQNEPNEQNSNSPQTNDIPKSTESNHRGWWKPLFGKKGKPKAVEDDKETAEESESSESESEADTRPKRCLTPHGGSASEYDDSSEESDRN